MIKFDNVSFSYGDEPTLENISFNIIKGDFVAILGENGAGKSTLSKLFNGLLKPDTGDVIIKGMNTKTTKTSTLAKHIGFLFQNPDRQICKNTIYDEIMFGLSCVSRDKDFCQSRCSEMIELFSFDKEKDPFSLSRGERQKIALASVLAVQPEILILDEPTTGLDYKECMKIMGMVKELNESGITVVMISHDMEIVLDFAKSVMVMNNGKVAAFDQTRNVMKNKDILEQASLLPPQIAQLSMELDHRFADVFTTDEFVRIILNEEMQRGAVI